MRPTPLRIAYLLLITLAWAACVRLTPSAETVRPVGSPTPVPPGWTDLLAPNQISHWRNITDDKNIFEIRDGMLHIYGRTLFPLRYVAYTARTYGDFDLHIEFRVAPGANSGVFLRAGEDNPVQRGFEVQVLDDHGKAPTTHTSGAIYDVVSPMFNMSLPAGSWNSYDISTRGTRVTVHMNGWQVIHTDFSNMTQPIGKFKTPYAELPVEGFLALQDHGGEVWYRNIRIREARGYYP